MNQDVKSLVSRLETRTRQLMLQYDKLQQLLAETEQKLSEQKRLCLALEDLVEFLAIGGGIGESVDLAGAGDVRGCKNRGDGGQTQHNANE